MKDLKLRWQQLFEFSENKKTIQSTIDSGFENLLCLYAEKHRYYHTIKHIKACLGFFDEVKSSISDAKSLEIALWFHDVIYEPNRNDNEEQSALFAKSFLKSIHGDSYCDIQKIETLILQTKHPSNITNNDEKYLVDIDLAILGASNELYKRYETWIRKEYKQVPDSLYIKGRKKVLNSFIDLERIYQTDYFYERFEIQANKNLKTALKQLSSNNQ